MPSTGTCTGNWTAGTGTGTCNKVLVAKTKSFSAVIDTLWHLYSKTLSVWTTGFLPARRYASAGYSDRNVSVCPSVCLSVRPSVRHAPVLCQNEES